MILITLDMYVAGKQTFAFISDQNFVLSLTYMN